MKSIYFVVFAFVAITLVINFIFAKKSNRPVAKYSAYVMLAAIIATASQLVLLMADNSNVALISLSFFYMSIDLVLVLFLFYCIFYTSGEVKLTLFNKMIIGITGLDILMLISNYFTGKVFGVYYTILYGTEVFYKADLYKPYYLHLGFCYFICLCCLFILIRKIIKLPRVYWARYYFLFLGFLAILFWDGLYVFTTGAIYTSLIGIGICAFILNYYGLFYEPKSIIQSMLTNMVSDMNDLVLLFDVESKCIYANDAAIGFFDISSMNDDILGHIQPLMDKAKADWRTCDYNYTVVAGIQHNGTYYNFEIHYNRLEKNGTFLGWFYEMQDRTKQLAHLEKERFLAEHDRLTGVYNKEKLYSEIDFLLDQNPDKQYYIVSCDIKDFKLINDIYGSEAGDKLLCKITENIKIRAHEDTRYGRIGNDKFGMIINKKYYDSDLLENGPKKIIHLDEDFLYPLVIHVGVYDIDNGRLPVSIMFDRTFLAIATIKNNFDTRVAYYDNAMRNKRIWEQKITGEIQESLDNEYFVPYLQPQITSGGELEGAEALVRWNHPTEGFLAPYKFIPTFEANGSIVKLDIYMWEQTCKILKAWKNKGYNKCISVNISPKDFYYIDVYKEITSLVKKYDIPPQMLRLEITETVFIKDADNKSNLLTKLRSEGFLIEMDDFGSGYSSLNMLKDLPIDVLKIDMKFLSKSNDKEKSDKIVAGVVRLAKDIGMTVVCEGVETEEDAEFLRKCGCDLLQGYFYDKPIPVDEFEKKYF
ncbi:MAG: EAL domain-containing protein [Butyrivibrio sp.]|nr:EAL domain-containing protein [Butyrivibrio sp.]